MSSAQTGARAWIDGAARGNPGAAGFGVLLDTADGQESLIGYLGRTTNNVAEYAGLVAALSLAVRRNVSRLEIFSDSQLMVRQMLGRYRVKAAHLKPLFLRASSLRREISRVDFHHIDREENSRADGLANRAIDERAPLPGWLDLGMSVEAG
jgi:ribonuclease HI